MSEPYPHLRRNFVAIAGDWICFLLAMTVVSYRSVTPAFVSRLTDFAPLIGLVATIGEGAWLLPQLVAAHHVAGREWKKPYVIVNMLVGRPMYLLVALAIFLTGDAYPWLLLAIFFLAQTIFTVTDALGSVGWFDILSKSIPPARRGRLFSTAQIVGGSLAFGAGFAVSLILGPRGPGFPYGYGLLFVLSVTFLFLSILFYSSLKEPPQEVRKEREPWRVYMPRLVALLRQNRQFRLINVVRMLAGLSGLALPFYVVYATDILQISDENIGLFVSAQVLGGIVSSFAMGYLNERSGSKIVTQMTIALAVSAPLLALLIHFYIPPDTTVIYIYALVFFLIGATMSGYMQGYMNFVLEMAPSDERPAYVGLYNTLGGTLLVVPLLGGWLLQSTSYPILFGAALIGPAASLALTFQLAEPRQE
jgi:MFS family permease